MRCAATVRACATSVPVSTGADRDGPDEIACRRLSVVSLKLSCQGAPPGGLTVSRMFRERP
jgi:hypothetical protein